MENYLNTHRTWLHDLCGKSVSLFFNKYLPKVINLIFFLAEGANVNWPTQRNQTKTTFKIVFLGKSGVGKTSVTLRYCRNVFQEGTEATIGYVCLLKTLEYYVYFLLVLPF